MAAVIILINAKNSHMPYLGAAHPFSLRPTNSNTNPCPQPADGHRITAAKHRHS